MADRVRATTVDNPFNPFTEWDNWYLYDISHGYNTCERLGRVAETADGLSDAENNHLIEEAIDEMVKYPAFNKNGEIVEYKKIYENS